MKKIIVLAIAILSIGLVAYTLASNKEEMKEEVASLQVKSEAIPVAITSLKNEEITGEVSVNGTLEPNARLTLMSETQGKVVKIYKRKGDAVSVGTPLLEVDNELLKAQLIAAEANFDKMKRDVARFENLIASDAITERDLEEMRLGLKNAEANYKSMQKRLADTYLKSPINGIIHEDMIEVGSLLTPGTKVYDIVDVSKLKLNVKVPETYILEVIEGQMVEIVTDVHPTEKLQGKVTTVAEVADNTLKYAVEIEVLNNKHTVPLKAGMYARVNFTFAPKTAIVLDRKAITGSIKNATVFVLRDGKAYQQPVTIGTVFDDKVTIVEGLAPSDQVVLSGQINLKDGTPVTTL